MQATREMINAAHGVTLAKGDVILSADLLTRLFEAMDFQRQKDDYYDGDTQDVLLAKITELEHLIVRQEIDNRNLKAAAQMALDALEGMSYWIQPRKTDPPELCGFECKQCDTSFDKAEKAVATHQGCAEMKRKLGGVKPMLRARLALPQSLFDTTRPMNRDQRREVERLAKKEKRK